MSFTTDCSGYRRRQECAIPCKTYEGQIKHRHAAKSESPDLWHRRWDKASKGRVRLIPTIRVWLKRKQGENNYHIIQSLPSHGGYYRHYMYRFGLDNSPNYPITPQSPRWWERIWIVHCWGGRRTAYGFLCHCKNTGWAAEESKQGESLKDEKHERLKQTHLAK